MSTTHSTRTSVTLREGQSIMLSTGRVEPAPLPLSQYVLTRLGSNDLRALRTAFEYLSCAWTTEACHRYVAHCPQHPRPRLDESTLLGTSEYGTPWDDSEGC